MALTLDTALASSQNSTTRHPLVDITSFQRVPDIPFDGELLHTVTRSEREPVCLVHSSGRLIAASLYGVNGSGSYGINYTYTDMERTEFTHVDITLSANPSGISIVELANGNIGMVYIDGTYNLRYRIITPLGVAVSSGTIATWTSTAGSSHVWVSTVGSDYMVVYVKGQVYTVPTSGGTYVGTTNDTYYITMQSDGTETTATFTWRKGSDAESAVTTCDGTNQALAEGVTIRFNAGAYYAGQIFKIPVVKAINAIAKIWIGSLPVDGTTVTIGTFTYTFSIN